MKNLVQLFNAESNAIGIKPVHGIAKYVFDKIVNKMVMFMSLIILTQNDSYNFSCNNIALLKATVIENYSHYIAQR